MQRISNTQSKKLITQFKNGQLSKHLAKNHKNIEFIKAFNITSHQKNVYQNHEILSHSGKYVCHQKKKKNKKKRAGKNARKASPHTVWRKLQLVYSL